MELAHEVAVDVCRRLWEDWGYEGGSSSKRPVQVYTVNVPLIEDALAREKRKVCWTRMWRNSYGQLFKPTKQ
jgi:tubulin--tyrosine ligase